MKRITKYIGSLLICLVVYTVTASAQSYLFKVLASQGNNQYKSSSDTRWQPVKTGTTLKNGDELIVEKDAYLGLVHNSGKTLELRKGETVNVNELANNIQVESSVVSKYADFVLNKFNETSEMQDRLEVTGAVTRGESEKAIKIMMPLYVEALRKDAIIKWTAPQEGLLTYVVTLRNIFDEVIQTIETSKTELTVDLSKKELANQRLIVVNVSVKGMDDIISEDYGIKPPSQDKIRKVNQDLQEMNKVLDDETSLNQVMKAAYYEENNLLIDALTSYEKAVELSPSVEDYQKLYESFILRNNLK